MTTIKITIQIVALLIGGWLAFDGTRALVTGDYVTPRTGPSAGQLGPWSKVVLVTGLDPRSKGVKWVHVVLGLLWLASLVMFVAHPALGRYALVGCSVLSLWYLPIGTILSIVELYLLFRPVARNLR